MPLTFIPARGCVFRPMSSTNRGFYALSPAIPSPRATPILIDGVDNEEGDTVFPMATLDSKKYLYVLGEDFGGIQISGAALLGKASEGGKAFALVKNYFQKHRVSASGEPITASLPGNVSYRVYLTRFLVARPDPEFHIQYFSFRGVVVDPPKKRS